MKMGNIASPWHYDILAYVAPQSPKLRRSAIARYASMRSNNFGDICVDTRHANVALSPKVNKTDANDAFGRAHIMSVSWYREVTVKGLDCQAVRALQVARAQIVSQSTTLKNGAF
jgi:hypothetical protein